MEIDLVQWHFELREFIQSCFLGAPIETVFPVGDEVTNIIDAGAVGPCLTRGGIRETGETEAGFLNRHGRVWNSGYKWFGLPVPLILLVCGKSGPTKISQSTQYPSPHRQY